MKFKFSMLILLIFLLSVSLFSQIEDAPKIDVKLLNEDPLEIAKGEELLLDVEINIPDDFYIYLESKYAVVVDFLLSDYSLFKITNIEKPEGKEYHNDIVLSENGIFKVSVSIKDKIKTGKKYSEFIKVKYGMCNSVNGTCFPPSEETLQIIINVKE